MNQQPKGVDIQIQEIKTISNYKTVGQIDTEELVLWFEPRVDGGKVNQLFIKWEVNQNLNNVMSVNHRSSTLFRCKDIDFNNIFMLSEPMLDIFTELTNTALAHTRVLFLQQNPEAEYTLQMFPHHVLKNDVKKQIVALLN